MKMENKPKMLQDTKNIFEKLKTDPKSILFPEEEIDKRLLKKLKKSSYDKDNLLLKLINLTENDIGQIKKTNQIPTNTDYVKKGEIDKSTLYSFDGPSQLVHADVANLEFLGKSATVPRYALLVVDLYLSKVCVYSMRSRKWIIQKSNQFYDEIKKKEKKYAAASEQ